MLPELFLKRMRPLLGAELEPLIESLTDGQPVRALRTTAKAAACDPARLLSEFSLRPVPYEPTGYYVCGDGIGHTPMHHAGGIYVQDPGAMAAVSAVDITPDMHVCDVCAAPGGKTSQAAYHIRSGFVLSNEIIPSRAKITVSNIERLGLSRSVVTSLSADALGELYEAYFDLVIVDAPCSGEGMFRKNEQAITEWSEEHVRACAERQRHILDCAARLVRSGGKLLYSTCTFSPEENELCVDAFLDRHPNFTLTAPSARVMPFTAPGLDLPYRYIQDPALCRRFYPHVAPGEGQFFAVLERTNDDVLPRILYKDASSTCPKGQKDVIHTFLSDTFEKLDGWDVRTVGERLVLLPYGITVPQHAVFCAGVMIGEVRAGRLLPHHQLFSAFGDRCRNRVTLSHGDARIEAYLRGEEIADEGESGFCAVLYEGMTLGGGKRSSGRVKNHYPKGLRM